MSSTPVVTPPATEASPRKTSRLLTGLTGDAGFVVLAVAAAIFAEWANLSDPNAYPVDSTIHVYWMFGFQDPDLFRNDPITQALIRTGQVPPGVQAIYWLGALFVSPTTVAKILPLILAPLAAWLVFRIAKKVSSRLGAAWLAGLLFLFCWDIHRFSGGNARAFAVPIALLAVLLALGRRDRLAAAVPPVGALLYPPAALTTLAILGFSSLRWKGRAGFDGRRLALVVISAALTAGALLLPQALGSASRPVSLSREEAMRLPDLGPEGQRPFFTPSLKKFLKQNRSGFDLRESGSIVAVGAAFLLLVRPRNLRALRGELFAMFAGSLTMFALAHLLLFRLYHPHRYTYPLVPLGCIVIGVLWRPTTEWLTGRFGAAWAKTVLAVAVAGGLIAVALSVMPLGPEMSPRELAGWFIRGVPLVGGFALAALGFLAISRRGRGASAATVAVVMSAVVLVGGTATAGKLRVRAHPCGEPELLRYLGTLPKGSVIAGDPAHVKCVPIASERPVVMSRKLYNSVTGRARMRTLIDAYYGDSVSEIIRLRTRYSADYLVVREKLLERNAPAGQWAKMEPFTSQIRELLRTVDDPAALRLPPSCQTWHMNGTRVYDLVCIERVEAGS